MSTPPEINPQTAEQSVFLSPLAEAFQGKSPGITQGTANEFFVAYTVLYRRFQRVLRRFLTEYAAFTGRREAEHWGESRADLNALMDAYQDGAYVAFEIFELYSKKLTPLMRLPQPARVSFDKSIRELRREVSILCNRSKHNGAFLQFAEVHYSGGERAAGFAFYQLREDHYVICRDVHPKGGAYSFNWSIRRIVGALLQADYTAAELVGKARASSSQPLHTSSFTLPILLELAEVASLPAVPFPQERTAPMISVKPPTFFEVDWAAEKRQFGKGELKAFLDTFSHAQTVELPYGGTARLMIKAGDNPPPPLTGFTRLVLGGIEVDDGPRTL